MLVVVVVVVVLNVLVVPLVAIALFLVTVVDVSMCSFRSLCSLSVSGVRTFVFGDALVLNAKYHEAI